MKRITDEQHREAQNDAAMLLRMAINEAKTKRNANGVWVVIWGGITAAAYYAGWPVVPFVTILLAFSNLIVANSAWKTVISYTEEYNEKYGKK